MFRCILVPILALLLIIAMLLNVAGTLMSATLDTYVGKGEKYISTPADKKGWNADYYQVMYDNNDDAIDAAYQVALQVAEEGSILLKNNGVLLYISKCYRHHRLLFSGARRLYHFAAAKQSYRN